MRNLWILCFLLWLASSLQAMQFETSSEKTSPNGLYRCLSNDEFLLYRGERLLWRRPGQLLDTIAAVSNDGRVLMDGAFAATLVDVDGRTHSLGHSTRSAWFGATSGHVLVERDGKLYRARLESDSALEPITQEQFQQECANPQADTEKLLTHAVLSGQQPTAQLLRRCVQVKEFHWLALGLQARVEPGLARRLLHLSHRGEEEGWLKALAIARPEQVLSELRKLRGLPNHPQLFSEALYGIWDSQPDRGRRQLLAFLQAPGSLDRERAELICILSYHSAPELNALFLSLTAGQPKAVGEASVRALIRRGQLESLLPLLRQPIGREDILRHLQGTPAPNSVDILEELLNQPHLDPVTLALVMDALRFQCRLNLGHNPAHWRSWLGQRGPARARFSEMPKSQLTGLLAAAWDGRLTVEDLTGTPRLERVVDRESGEQQFEPQVDSQGEWMLEPKASGERLTSLITGKVLWPQSPYGPHGDSCNCSAGSDLSHRLQVLDIDRQAVVREYCSGKLLHRWQMKGVKSPLRRPVICQDGRLVAMRGKLWEIPSGRPLYSLPDGWTEISSSQPACLAGYASTYLFDLARQKKVLDFGSRLGRPKFARDGKSVIYQGDGLEIYDLAGRCQLDLKTWSGCGDVSGDARWVVDGSHAELQLTQVTGNRARQTRRLAVSQPLACWFNQDATQVLAVYPETIVIHRVPDLQVVARWPLPGHSFSDVLMHPPQWCGKRLVSYHGDQFRIWNTSGQPLSAPPEHQRLLSELWTGCRLQGGLPVVLTQAEYRARCLRWRSLGGGAWSLRPQSVRSDGGLKRAGCRSYGCWGWWDWPGSGEAWLGLPWVGGENFTGAGTGKLIP